MVKNGRFFHPLLSQKYEFLQKKAHIIPPVEESYLQFPYSKATKSLSCHFIFLDGIAKNHKNVNFVNCELGVVCAEQNIWLF